MAVERFFTDAGIEIPAITTDQMREVDRIAIEETGPNLFQMMENAGRNLATLALRELGEGRSRARVLVMAGTGGNGGGGICAARHLANHGVEVSVCITQPERLGDVPAWQLKVFSGTPGKEVMLDEVRVGEYDLVLDAVIGYSLGGPPRGAALDAIELINALSAPAISLDNPSGLDTTTGETPGAAVSPEATMTLALPKTGLLPGRTGNLYLTDIGIPFEVYRCLGVGFQPPFSEEYIVPLHS